MANFSILSGTHTITATEWSIAQDAAFSASTPRTTAGYVQAFIDRSAMVAGDTYTLTIYKRCNGGTLRPIMTPATIVPGADLYFTPLMMMSDGWDISLKLATGAASAILFDTVQDTNTIDAITVGSFGAGAITSTTFAAGAITAAAIATGAVDADAIATDAVTEIQAGLATADALTTAQTDLTTLTGRLTTGRAAALDNLDATISSRAAAATAVSTANLTTPRIALLDNLDAAVSTRATAAALTTVAGNVTTIISGVGTLQADTDDIQTRLPAALDGSGNIKAAVQSTMSGAITAIVAAFFAFEEESTAPVGARTFLQRLRIKWSILSARAGGLAISAAGTENFRDAANTKNRATFTLDVDGSRVPGTLDGD